MIFDSDKLIGGSHLHNFECNACQHIIYESMVYNLAIYLRDHAGVDNQFSTVRQFAEDCGVEWNDVELIFKQIFENQSSLTVEQRPVKASDVGSNPTSGAN